MTQPEITSCDWIAREYLSFRPFPSLALSSKEALKRQKTSLAGPHFPGCHPAPSPRRGRQRGLGGSVWAGALFTQPPALNREQGRSCGEGACAGRAGGREGTGSDALGVWKPTKKGKSVFNKPGFLCCQPPPLLVRKREARTPNLTRAPCALPVHTGSWRQAAMTHC